MRHLGVYPVYVQQRLPVQNFFSAAAVDSSVFQKEEPAAEPQGQIQIVNDHDSGKAVSHAKFPDSPQDLILILNIQRTGWLV